METVYNWHRSNVPIIRINKYWYNYKSRIIKHFYYKSKKEAMKCALLHEIGHIKVGYKKNQAMNEYLAHMWAIKKAKYLKMKTIKKQLEKDISDWVHFKWNKEKYGRKYILASKIYKKKINYEQ